MSEGNLYNPATRWSERQRQDQEDSEETIFFTTLRQQGVPSEQITFRLKNGCYHTLPLAEITEIYYQAAAGIVLFFRMGFVWIQGRNLGKLHQHLQARKVTEIREFSPGGSVFFDKEALFISGIRYESENLQKLELIAAGA